MVVLDASMPFSCTSRIMIGGAGCPLSAWGVPRPPSPWQAEHLVTKIAAPCAAVPSPGGRPVPSARTSISQRAMSAGLPGFPRFRLPEFAPAAKAVALPVREKQTSAANTLLGVGMRHLPVRVHRPARDCVEMMVSERHHGRHGIELSTGGDKLRPRGLERAMVVPGATLQHDGASIPSPWHAEAGEGLAVNRRLQGSFPPALAAVGRDHHLGDLAFAGIGDAGNLVVAGRFHVLAR